jgi:hypothetical protein
MQENHKTFKKLYANKDSQESIDYKEFNDQYVDSEMKKAQLLKDYYVKLQKVLSPQTIHAYFRAERSFRKDLLKEIDENRRLQRQK